MTDMDRAGTAVAVAQPETDDFPIAVFSVEDIMYGVSSRYVLSIEILGGVTPMVDAPPYMCGIANFRGDMISLIDMRALFGIKPMAEQLRDFMQGRIGDHERWMAALESSAETGSTFTLATDPHACAFGKWYDSFKTDSNALNLLLGKIDHPHKKLHASAIDVNKAIAEKRLDDARQIVVQSKNTSFKETIELLRQVDTTYAEDSNTMLIVLDVDGHIFGIVVDNIISVEFISRMLPVPQGGRNSPYVAQLGKRDRDDATVLFLNVDAINEL